MSKILENTNWARAESIINVNGRKYGETALKGELNNLRHVRDMKERSGAEVPKELKEQINALEGALEKHQAKVVETGVSGDFVRINSKDHGYGWGRLEGVMIDRGILQDLQVLRGDFKVLKKTAKPGETLGYGEKLTNGLISFTNTFKFAKVPANIPTVARNVISTSQQLWHAGIGLKRQFELMPSTIKEMTSNGKIYKEAGEHGLFKGTLTSEQFQFLEKFSKNMTAGRKSGEPVHLTILRKVKDMKSGQRRMNEL